MSKTQAPLSESIRNKLDTAFKNGIQSFSEVIKRCPEVKTTLDYQEQLKLERIHMEALEVVRKLNEVQSYYKGLSHGTDASSQV